MVLRLLSESEPPLDRLLDSLLPVIASIAWIIAIRLVNKWLPKGKDEDEEEPDLPMD